MKTSRAPKTTSRKTVAIRLTGESSECQHPFLAKRHWLTPGATFTEHYLHRMRSKRLSPLKPLWTGWKESGRAATALSLKRPTRLLGTPTALFGQPPARSAGTSLTFALPTTRNRGLQGSRVFFERDGTDIWNLNTSKPVFGCMEMWECMWLCRFIFLVYIYFFCSIPAVLLSCFETCIHRASLFGNPFFFFFCPSSINTTATASLVNNNIFWRQLGTLYTTKGVLG